ncbi:hypothetical protein FQA39_LY17987 [Lamprigera yunnana]|nr:hypothetical protein FQA39_LY17987 [Lamprigera yunnana]
MDIDSIENCVIKSEVILTETFCEKYEDCESKELKTEPVDYEESFKRKEEEDPAQYVDTNAAPLQRYSCNGSSFIKIEKDSLTEHSIAKNVQYFCKKCDFATQLECSMKEHLRIHNGTDNICTFDKCNFKTLWIFSLIPQLNTSISANQYICNDSNYPTLRENYLRKHMKIYTGNEYKCNDCEYKTVCKSRLNQHVKIHIGDEYKCEECSYKTVWKDSLKDHMKIHVGEEYKCKECDYKTLRERCLKEHVKMHTGDEYKCKDCDYKTLRERRLKEHVKIHTGDEYRCKECGYKTVRKYLLKLHMNKHTGDLLLCKKCGFKTNWKCSLQKHLKIHT